MKRAFIATSLLLLTSLTLGCQSKMGGGCAGGQCGLLGGSCPGGACAADSGGYAGGGGAPGGPLAAMGGHHRQGAQAHMGATPGPAQGQAMPTYGYPYYTTRGPRDFLNGNPPSIGR